MEDRLLSVEDLRFYLGVNRDTIYKWINEKGLPALKIGRLWKFRKVEVNEWVKQFAFEKPIIATKKENQVFSSESEQSTNEENMICPEHLNKGI